MSQLRRLLRPCSVLYQRQQGIKKWYPPVMIDFQNRRKIIGPDPPSPRSDFVEWNYAAELSAFGARLGEKFNDDTLRTSFVHRSYLDQQRQKRLEMGMQEPASDNVPDNSELAAEGNKIMSQYVKRYLRHCLPYLPEEGIISVHDHLMSEDVLSYVSLNLGTKDLLLSADFPPESSTLSATLKALVGALARDQDVGRAEIFVQDFLLTQLLSKDIGDILDIQNPMKILTDILGREKRGLPEPRLLRETGRASIVSTFVVGVYSDRVLIGQGPGETLDTAEEMAAYDALRRLFRITERMQPLPFGEAGRKLKLNREYCNIPLAIWTTGLVEEQLANRKA